MSFVFIEGRDVRQFSSQADPTGHDEDASQIQRDLGLEKGQDSCGGTGTYQCEHAGGYNGNAEIGHGSCSNGDSICYGVGNNGYAVIGNSSCLDGVTACQLAGSGGNVTIGNNSSRPKDNETSGQGACEFAGYEGSAVIGNNSCRGYKACYELQGTVGNDSCNCEICCKCLKPGEKVPDDSCNKVEDQSDDPQCCFSDGRKGNKNLSPNANGGGGMYYLMFTITQ